MTGKRAYRRRHRRLKPWAVGLLVLLVVGLAAGGAFFLKGMSGNKAPEGENTGGQQSGQDQQLDATVPDSGQDGDGESETDSQGESDGQTETGGTPAGYTIQTMTEADIGIGGQILVSNEHKYTFPEGAEDDLVAIIDAKSSSYTVNLYETMALPETVEHLNTMLDDYVAQGGQTDVMVVSGYRTYDFQQGLFDRSAARNGLEHAQRFVAQAGGSEHHTGYAVDLYSTNQGDYLECTGEYAWIGEHCQDYGFILRYTTEKEEFTKIGPESWHFRYIGFPHAQIIVENGFCLEEYIDYLRQFPFDGDHLWYTLNGTEYEIYFVEGLEVPVPESGEYTVSGNNVDGFIVTVTH